MTEPLFRYCLNTSTIMGQKLGVEQEMRLAAAAGYDGIEVWVRSLRQFVDAGGKLVDLATLADDLGLRVENAIGFAPWIVDDDFTRSEGLVEAEQDMEMLAALGCLRIAAPPAGAADGPVVELEAIAERFAALGVVADAHGVQPQLELWGHSTTLSTMSELLSVAARGSRHPVGLLMDVYHLYKGGSDERALGLIDGSVLEIFHINDYPARPRAELGDADRVYPGDGDAPLDRIIGLLAAKRSEIVLSLELFNRSYWDDDAAAVAATGLRKMKAVVNAALG